MSKLGITRLACLMVLALFTQLSCAVGKSEIRCTLIDEETGGKVPAKYVIRSTGPEPSYTCIDRKGKGCTIEVESLTDYDVFCYPLEYGYKLIDSESQNVFPGNRVTFYCTD